MKSRLYVSLAVLGLGCAVAGCQKSSRSPALLAIGSTAAAQTAAGQTTPSATAVQPPVGVGAATRSAWAAGPGVPIPPSFHTSAIDLNNAQLAALWIREGKQLVADELTKQLQGLIGQNSQGADYQLEVIDVQQITYDLDQPPGFPELSTKRVALAAPLQGAWSASFDAHFLVRQRIAGLWIDLRPVVTVDLQNLRISVALDLDDADPAHPTVRVAGPPQVTFHLQLRTQNPLVGLLTPFLNQVLDPAVRAAFIYFLLQNQSIFRAAVGQPQTFGTGGPPLAAPPAGVDYLAPALAIDASLQATKMPWNTVTDRRYDAAYTKTWTESFADPSFQPIASPDPNVNGDSSIWTGHYLAAEAIRYALTGDAQARGFLVRTLDGVHDMVHVRGTPGLLNRGMFLATTPAGIRSIASSPERYSVHYKGQDWVGHDFISRDQYLGVLLGLSVARQVLPDASLRQRAADEISTLFGYLDANDWVAYKRTGEISSAWHANFPQQRAWVLAGAAADPVRFGQVERDHRPLADLIWFPIWIETFDPIGSYFKFNLEYGAMHVVLTHETDRVAWQQSYKGLRILRRALGHHQNPWFDVVEAASDPGLVNTLASDVQETLRLWLERPRRQVPVDYTNDPTIPKTTYTAPLQLPGPGAASAAAPLPVAAQTVPVNKRPPTDFLWQRDPFRFKGGGSPNAEEPGIDYLLPYWMGRYYGLIP